MTRKFEVSQNLSVFGGALHDVVEVFTYNELVEEYQLVARWVFVAATRELIGCVGMRTNLYLEAREHLYGSTH